MNKFQVIFLHTQYEYSKFKSVVLFNTTFAAGKLQLPAPDLFDPQLCYRVLSNRSNNIGFNGFRTVLNE